MLHPCVSLAVLVVVPAHQDPHQAAREAVRGLVVPVAQDQAEVGVHRAPAVAVLVAEVQEEEGEKEREGGKTSQGRISPKIKTRRVNPGRLLLM